LAKKIYERNEELGECFEKNINFISFENDILTWESKAEVECKKNLITYWSVIKFLAKDIFGIDTQIKAVKSTKQKNPKQNPSPTQKEEPQDQPMPSSCIQSCVGLSDTKEEVDANDILQTPFIKKAIELFDVQKIKIKSKI